MLAEIIPKIAGFDKEENYKFNPRPSLAGPERCLRQMVYWGLGRPRDPISDRLFLTMDDSRWHEELTLDWLRKSGFVVHSEQMVVNCPSPMGKGSIDGIITDMVGKDYLLEHKALSHFSFQAIWDGRFPKDYFTQTAIYLWGLQEVNPQITEAILLIKNKNTAQYLEFKLEYNKQVDILKILEMVSSIGDERKYPDTVYENIVKSACQKFDEVLAYVKDKKLPKRPFDLNERNSYPCSYCGWKEICWQGIEDEFKQLAVGKELAGDIEDLCGHYQELKMHIDNMDKEKDELKGKIKNILAEQGVREGLVGDRYIITLRLQKREWIDKELIPEVERTKYLKVTQSEILNIRNQSKKKGGEK